MVSFYQDAEPSQEWDHAAEAPHSLAHQGAELRLEVGLGYCPKSDAPRIHLC